MKLGVERLCEDARLRAPLAGRRLALLAHPASVTRQLEHSIDALAALGDLKLTAAFGPQHGLRGDKQDNMVESPDFPDPRYGFPVFSLYGEVRRPTEAMLEHCDVILVDLQDLGTRVYTFITTLRYILEAAAEHGKAVWILDRPNPIGRPVEGLILGPGWSSFVGAGPMPMRHGMTLGEIAKWFVAGLQLDVELVVIEMEGWEPEKAPGYGWPMGERSWVNPSPNAPTLSMARAYPGTVQLEGTLLSEGRGTTRPLELFGGPDVDARALLAEMERRAPRWLDGCRLRPCWFEPTFHKHSRVLCEGLQIHVDDEAYDPYRFRPWRLMALVFKAQVTLQPEREIWREFPYEYEHDRLAIDLINGGEALRRWVDDDEAEPQDLDHFVSGDEEAWREEREPYLLYR